MLLLGIDELVEVAPLTVGGLFLVDEFEAVLVELLEEFVPGDLVEFRVVTVRGIREAEAQDSRLVAGVRALHLRGLCAACFRPLANFVVILRRL